jgi:hypothetical protein
MSKDGGYMKKTLSFIKEQPSRALFFRQLYILLMRDLMVARRDYGLYYTQSMMTNIFSFLIGAILMNIKFTISADLLALYGGTSLIIFVMCNVHIFKAREGDKLLYSLLLPHMTQPLPNHHKSTSGIPPEQMECIVQARESE